MSTLKNTLRVLVPIAIVACGAGLASLLVSLRPEPETVPRPEHAPLVEVTEAVAEDVTLAVRTHGTVVPRTESRLVAEVAGRVLEVSPSLVNGGFFQEDEVLLRIDPIDYRLAVEEARSRIALAELRLAQERADAEIARADWERLGVGEPDGLVLREPQLVDARAQLEAARAALAKAQRDIERCTVRAPYPGRVRTENVDAGQYVNRGEELARGYAVDWAEIRLPLPDADLAYIDLPLSYRPALPAAMGSDGNGAAPSHEPTVTLTAHFAGREQTWQGRLVRTEGEIDPKTRMVVAVARVEDPYGLDGPSDRPPLAVGMFVEAEIEGVTVRNAVALPRAVLRGVGQVYVLDGQGRLRFRAVEVLQMDRDRMILSAGVEPGELVVTTPIETATDGMRVRRAAEEVQ